MMPTTWTPEEDQTALRMRGEEKTISAISHELNRTWSSVECRLRKLDKAEAKRKAAPKVRPCLCCNNNFLSAGPHNRLCLDCRRKDVSPYATF